MSADLLTNLILIASISVVSYCLGRRKMPSERTMIEHLVKLRARRMVEFVARSRIEDEINAKAMTLAGRAFRS